MFKISYSNASLAKVSIQILAAYNYQRHIYNCSCAKHSILKP